MGLRSGLMAGHGIVSTAFSCSMRSGIVIHEDGSCGYRMIIKMGDNSSLKDLLLIPRPIKVTMNSDEVHLATKGNASPYHNWPSPKWNRFLDITWNPSLCFSRHMYDHPPYAVRNDSYWKKEPSTPMQSSSEDVDHTRQVVLLCELGAVLHAWWVFWPCILMYPAAFNWFLTVL